MAAGATSAAQVVQAAGDFHDGIGQAFGGVAERVFGNATDFHAGNRMLHAHPHPGQATIVPFLARFQLRVLGLFFGWRCAFTSGA